MCDKPLDESLAMNRIGLKQLLSRSVGRVVSHPKTIRKLLNMKFRQNLKSNGGVYCISCNNSKIKYISETSGKPLKCLYEHKRDIRLGNFNNALFLHISEINHNFNFDAATMLAHIHNKRLRQIFEARAISLLRSVNSHSGFSIDPLS